MPLGQHEKANIKNKTTQQDRAGTNKASPKTTKLRLHNHPDDRYEGEIGKSETHTQSDSGDHEEASGNNDQPTSCIENKHVVIR
jgi:hypothetical protein